MLTVRNIVAFSISMIHFISWKLFKVENIIARWVFQLLSNEKENVPVAKVVSQNVVTCDETYVHYFKPMVKGWELNIGNQILQNAKNHRTQFQCKSWSKRKPLEAFVFFSSEGIAIQTPANKMCIWKVLP